MKKFLNKNTGLVEIVNNKEIIEQYEKYPEIYEEIKKTKKTDKKWRKVTKVSTNRRCKYGQWTNR